MCLLQTRVWRNINRVVPGTGRSGAKGHGSYILAAGGLLEREDPDGVHIAVIHRTRYRDSEGAPGDYVLPKGKLAAGESIEEAALREVEEETGCRARILGPSFPCEYRVERVPKIVQFFRMACVTQAPVKDTSEVREVLWLAPGDALARLTYATERDVVRRAYPQIREEGA